VREREGQKCAQSGFSKPLGHFKTQGRGEKQELLLKKRENVSGNNPRGKLGGAQDTPPQPRKKKQPKSLLQKSHK